MLIKIQNELPEHAITPPEVYAARRTFLKYGLTTTLTLGSGLLSQPAFPQLGQAEDPAKLELTPLKHIQNYTNFYEYSYNKEDSSIWAQNLTLDPWSIEINGAVARPGHYHLEDILHRFPAEERIYRFRCVEAWAMVVPWLGFPLADLLKLVEPTSKARFVQFTSVLRPEVMPNTRRSSMLIWPYTEALRLDEALHPLTLLAFGMYGKPLAKQNGAPLRLVVPWKYGFKSIKAIVKISLLEQQPISSWSLAAPKDYGFYANVNPSVPHPRWSQATERLLGSRFFTPRRRTELFNGYAEQVGELYSHLDLERNF